MNLLSLVSTSLSKSNNCRTLLSLNVHALIKYGKQLGVIGFDWMGEKNPNEVFRNELIAAFQYFGTYILKKRGGIGLGGAHTIITLSQEEDL